GVAKLTDFGISRAQGDMTLTATGLVGGTPAYLAPELARGADPAPASDVFALGATLYHAIEGHCPYGDNPNQLALLHTAASGKVRPPMQAGKATALLMSMLRPEASERIGMAEAARRLAQVAASAGAPDTPAATMPALPPTGPGPWPRPGPARALRTRPGRRCRRGRRPGRCPASPPLSSGPRGTAPAARSGKAPRCSTPSSTSPRRRGTTSRRTRSAASPAMPS